MKNLQTGDVLFVEGKGIIGKGIALVTRSKVSHVGIIYNKDLIFETHAGQNARLNPIAKRYAGKNVLVYRPPLSDSDKEKVIKRCHKYNGSKYSMFDIGTNFLFAWMPSKLRRKIVAKLGRKSWMICSEITARILYDVNPTKFDYLKLYEGLQPGGVLKFAEVNQWKRINVT